MAIISREYEEFLREEQQAKKLRLYERLCEASEKILPLSPPFKGMNEKYKESIQFSHLKITPKGAFSLAILTMLAVFIVSLVALVLLNAFTLSSILLSLALSSIALYFLVIHPNHYATVFRINASSEMVLATIYMSISMHLSPNLENAIKFASRNLKGALSIDLRELLWGVYTRKYDKIEDALDYFIEKWKKDSK